MVDNADDEVAMIAVEGAQQNSKEVDVAVFDLSGLREDPVENCNNLYTR